MRFSHCLLPLNVRESSRAKSKKIAESRLFGRFRQQESQKYCCVNPSLLRCGSPPTQSRDKSKSAGVEAISKADNFHDAPAQVSGPGWRELKGQASRARSYRSCNPIVAAQRRSFLRALRSSGCCPLVVQIQKSSARRGSSAKGGCRYSCAGHSLSGNSANGSRP